MQAAIDTLAGLARDNETVKRLAYTNALAGSDTAALAAASRQLALAIALAGAAAACNERFTGVT